jgi:hypothetical protein
LSGQTDRIQYGIGAHASRASVMTGSATRLKGPSPPFSTKIAIPHPTSSPAARRRRNSVCSDSQPICASALSSNRG